MVTDLEKAEQQLTGFYAHWTGLTIVDLVREMGLTAKEWDELRNEVPWLPTELKQEIDEYFNTGEF